MKRKTAFIIYGIIGAIFLAVTGFVYVSQASAKKTSSETVTTAEESDPFEGLVQTVSGTSTDMLTAEYWLAENKEQILFSEDEIEAYRENNPSYLEYSPEKYSSKRKLYMYDLPETIDGEVVEALIDPEIIENFADEKTAYFANGEQVSSDYWGKIKDNLGLSEVDEKVIPRYAVCVKRTDARLLPDDDFIAKDPEEIYFDSLISSEIMPHSGVVILHESNDGNWYYVLNGSYCGWVHKETLALCRDKDEWLKAASPEEFLVVTGSDIILENTARSSESAGRILPMGTKISLTASKDKVADRMSWGCYVAEIPCRAESGELYFEEALIPVSKDVHVGYLEMTSEAVLTQAFKFLGKIYGYGGTLNSNDCSGFVRQVYSCFGFELPRNAKAIARLYDIGSIDCSKMTVDKKRSLLLDMPPGLLVFMEGHIMMYLGTKDGVPYVISSCATCIEPGHDTSDIVDAYGVFVSSMELRRANGNTWLEDMSYILWKEY